MKKYVIVVAGGKGLRMGGSTPKQFIEINGKVILLHTLEKIKKALPTATLFLVLPKSEIKRWRELARQTEFSDLKIAYGGTSRFHSVKAGLDLIDKPGIIGVHDAVRPLVSEETIRKTFGKAEEMGAAIPVIEVKDSLRKIEGKQTNAVDRSNYRVVQTPQCFQSELLIKSYQQVFSNKFTDDASVVEAHGEKIHLVKGNESNIKITTKEDLEFAKVLLNH